MNPPPNNGILKCKIMNNSNSGINKFEVKNIMIIVARLSCPSTSILKFNNFALGILKCKVIVQTK